MHKETLPDGIGRFADPARAFWHIVRLLSQNKAYSDVPLKRMLLLQTAITQGNYFCLMRDEQVRAAVIWRHVVVERFLRTRPHYEGTDSEPTDGVVLQSFVATDRLSLYKLWAHVESAFADKDIFYNRHKVKLGHRPRTR